MASLAISGAFAYLLPAFVALDDLHRHAKPIFALNVLLGRTSLGWVAALVWALVRSGGTDG